MKTIITRSILAIAVLTLSACAQFRINMRYGYGPHYPASPKAPFPHKKWDDVAEWQSFLKTKGYGLGNPKYPNDLFDRRTTEATERFQKASQLWANGSVTWATYYAAVTAGMTRYKPILTSPDPTNHPPHHHPGPRHGKHAYDATPKTAEDDFRLNLANGDGPSALPNGTMDNNGPWNDVYDWEYFLTYDMGYLTPPTYPNELNFNPMVKSMTGTFQAAAKAAGNLLSYSTGVVDQNTLNAAVNIYGMTPVHAVKHPPQNGDNNYP